MTAGVAARPFIWVALRKLRRWLPLLFGVVVLGVLISHAHKVDWRGAWHALQGYSPILLLQALALATLSHGLYGLFDLIGRRHTRHKLGRLHTWAIAVASYAFNLNLGALIGGVALRVRLYLRAGLDEATVAQVLGLSLVTNWMGYGLLAGSLFAAGVIEPPEQAHLHLLTFRWLGAGMVALAAGYVAACAALEGRIWVLGKRRLKLPSWRTALVQLGVSALNWAVMGATMYLLLGQQVGYGTTLGVLMAASIVGVVTPIPAGLGVLEGVYLALLSGTVEQGTLMGAVLAYRALYYLVPLGGALLLYMVLERTARASTR